MAEEVTTRKTRAVLLQHPITNNSNGFPRDRNLRNLLKKVLNQRRMKHKQLLRRGFTTTLVMNKISPRKGSLVINRRDTSRKGKPTLRKRRVKMKLKKRRNMAEVDIMLAEAITMMEAILINPEVEVVVATEVSKEEVRQEAMKSSTLIKTQVRSRRETHSTLRRERLKDSSSKEIRIRIFRTR